MIHSEQIKISLSISIIYIPKDNRPQPPGDKTYKPITMFKFNESYFEGVIFRETSKKKNNSLENSPLAKLANERWESMTEEERKHAIENADKPF